MKYSTFPTPTQREGTIHSELINTIRVVTFDWKGWVRTLYHTMPVVGTVHVVLINCAFKNNIECTIHIEAAEMYCTYNLYAVQYTR